MHERNRENTVPAEISIQESERWMERPIEVRLSYALTEKTTTSSVIYLYPEEAEQLIAELVGFLDSGK